MLQRSQYCAERARVIEVVAFIAEHTEAQYLLMSELTLPELHRLSCEAETRDQTKEMIAIRVARSLRLILDSKNTKQAGELLGVGSYRAGQIAFLVMCPKYSRHVVEALLCQSPRVAKALIARFGLEGWPEFGRFFPNLKTTEGRAQLHVFVGNLAARLIRNQLPEILPPPPLPVEEPVADDTSPEATKICNLDISVRLRNCLDSRGFTTLGELTEHTAKALLQEIRNFGKRNLGELERILAEHGLRLKPGGSWEYSENDARSRENLAARRPRKRR